MTHQPPRACEDRDACDKDSIELVLGGKPAAFEDIVRRYSRMIFGLSYRMLGSREDAADAVQDIFARVFTALESFDRSRPFYPWLYSVAVNHLRSILRRRRRRPSPVSLEARREDDLPLLTPADTAADPEETAMLRLAERDAQSALDSLAPKYREVFVLRTVEELSVEDVARILKLAPGTVKTRLHRARRLLADMLTQ